MPRQKTFHDLLGAHVSIAGGLHKAILEATAMEATACQIFVKSSRSWHAKPLTEEEIDTFKTVWKASAIKVVVAHASYLINIASPDAKTHKNSAAALAGELARCEQLGIQYLVLHPGSHVGSGVEAGCTKIAETLNDILSKTKGITTLLLETAAGQGSNLGSTFEEIQSILHATKHKKKIGVCLDTCHIYSAGYDISTAVAYKKVMSHFDEVIGLNHLKVVHLNNSKNDCGARKDRHEKIEIGTLPITIFKAIMHDPQLKEIPKILETPPQKDPIAEYTEEIELLRSL